MTAPTDPRPLADREEDALIKVWQQAHKVFGADEALWTPAQIDGYVAARLTVHEEFAASVASGLTESYAAYEARMNAKEAT